MAASSSSQVLSQQKKCTLALLLVAALFIRDAIGCRYTSIFNFGDSISDTGNLYFSGDYPSEQCFRSPYGETYFHHPSGRCSNGRLIIDFIAQFLKLPLLKPYVGIKKGAVKGSDIHKAVNFAVIGATALDSSFFLKKGIQMTSTNDSLRIQLDWFEEFLPSLCNSSSTSSCKELLGSSLFLVGEIGGNDYNFPLELRKSVAEIRTYVPLVIDAITSAINKLIDLGARTIMVPGNFPIGCHALYLTMYESKDKKEYDKGGCLKWLNKFAKYHNEMLKATLNQLRWRHRHTNIIYADYYNAALPLFHSPRKFGFTGLKICCGGGGPYNCNTSASCGSPDVYACDDPSKYIGWDGIHLTETAYRLITKGLLEGSYTDPKFSTLSV